MRRDYISDVLFEDSDSSSFEKFLFSLGAEGGALVLCSRGVTSIFSSKLVYSILERCVDDCVSLTKNCDSFLTPGLPPWIVSGDCETVLMGFHGTWENQPKVLLNFGA